MSKAILKYKSDPKIYDIQSDGNHYHEFINDLSISEHFLANEKYKHISPALGDYYLTIETEVDETSELQSKYFAIKEFISELDRSWMYTCGHPLVKKVLTFTGPYVDFPDGNIRGWESNFRDAERELNKGKAHVVASFVNYSHSAFSYWPLQKALSTRKSYLAASKPIAALVDLHFFAHKVEDSYSSFLFLAKAMELVQAMLPGKTDDKKEKKLPDGFRSRLKTSLHHIMGLANTRYEIRHIVKEKQNCTLHESLNNDEINAYKHDADLFIRFVVCRELAIPLIIPERG
jgi:hypothetical protein